MNRKEAREVLVRLIKSRKYKLGRELSGYDLMEKLYTQFTGNLIVHSPEAGSPKEVCDFFFPKNVVEKGSFYKYYVKFDCGKYLGVLQCKFNEILKAIKDVDNYDSGE